MNLVRTVIHSAYANVDYKKNFDLKIEQFIREKYAIKKEDEILGSSLAQKQSDIATSLNVATNSCCKHFGESNNM